MGNCTHQLIMNQNRRKEDDPYSEEQVELMRLVARQWKEIISSSPSVVTCECGHNMPIRFAYRCLYCKVYFCHRCAEKHFGKTVDEHEQERLAMEAYREH